MTLMVTWVLPAHSSNFPSHAFGDSPPGPQPGWHDTGCTISKDGNVVVWFHREMDDTRICLLAYPFTGLPSTHKVSLSPRAALEPVLSGDGHHLFWWSIGTLCSATIHNGELGRIGAIPQVTGGQLHVNGDGSRLALIIAGPPAEGRYPGWYALATAAIGSDGTWKQSNLLTPTEPGKDAWAPVMTADGKLIVYAYEGRLFEWHEGESVKPLVGGVPEGRLEPKGLTPDGSRILFEAGKPDGKGGWINSIYFMDQSTNGWGKAVLVLEDHEFAVWNVRLSIAGDYVVFRKVVKPNSPRLETLQRIKLNRGVVAQPEILFDLPLNSDIQEFTLSRTGACVYSICPTQINSPSQVREHEVFLVPKLEPGAKPVSLSNALRKSLASPTLRK